MLERDAGIETRGNEATQRLTPVGSYHPSRGGKKCPKPQWAAQRELMLPQMYEYCCRSHSGQHREKQPGVSFLSTHPAATVIFTHTSVDLIQPVDHSGGCEMNPARASQKE